MSAVVDHVLAFFMDHIWDVTIGIAFMLLGVVSQGLGELITRRRR